MTLHKSCSFADMMNEATRKYILAHREEDVRRLALNGGKSTDVDISFALQQIAGWQTASKKLPSWAAVEGVIYPPHLNMEQCSSEQAARYKAKVISRYIDLSEHRNIGIMKEHLAFVDLTGGLGVDFYWMAKTISQHQSVNPLHLIYVERNPELCEMAQHNFPLLDLEAEVVCDEAESYLAKMPHANVVFLDPARRDEHGGRTYGIEDCTPNVIELLPLLKEKADTIILKLSPMLDWRKAVSDLGGVSEVHIVSVDNECKELLIVIRQDLSATPLLVCVNGDRSLPIIPNVGKQHSQRGKTTFPTWESNIPNVGKSIPSMGIIRELTLLEPNTSIMKAGCFKEIAQMYGIQQLSANSHLFVTDHDIEDFPGRRFRVERMTSMNKQELRDTMAGIDKANVAVRNFPLTADQLRKKLRLKDGGDIFIFGTTLSDHSHKLFICRKIG